MTFTRITIDLAVCTGKFCIRGLRFPVALVDARLEANRKKAAAA